MKNRCSGADENEFLCPDDRYIGYLRYRNAGARRPIHMVQMHCHDLAHPRTGYLSVRYPQKVPT